MTIIYSFIKHVHSGCCELESREHHEQHSLTVTAMQESASARNPDMFAHDASGDTALMVCLIVTGSQSSSLSSPVSYPMSRIWICNMT